MNNTQTFNVGDSVSYKPSVRSPDHKATNGTITEIRETARGLWFVVKSLEGVTNVVRGALLKIVPPAI